MTAEATITEREASALNAVDRMLNASSIAVVGATERAGYGARALNNLIQTGYTGKIYPINPNRETVFGMPCFPSAQALPEPPDLAIVIVPAEQVPPAIEQCAAAGAGAAIIISAGFAELGNDLGRARHAALMAAAGERGLRLLGPNCLGVANLGASIWATAGNRRDVDTAIEPVDIALISQSGASGFGPLLATARDRGVSYRYIVTTGNEADLGVTDFMHYFLLRPDVRVITMLVEGFRDFAALRRLADLAREREKALVVLKVGRSEAGQRAARSHTAALTGDDRVVEALFRQLGLVRVRDYDELIEQSALLLKAPLPRGKRVGVISHSGGIGAHLTDQLGAEGFEVPPFTGASRQALADLLGERGSSSNPADTTTQTHGPGFGPLLHTLFADPDLDAWLIASQGPDHFIELLESAAATIDRPVGIVWTGSQTSAVGLERLRRGRLPSFALPSGGARGLAALARLAEARSRRRAEPPQPPSLDIPRQAGTLSEHASKRLLAAAGLAMPPESLCQSVEQALAAAESLGYPVVLKACGADLTHKSEHGLVELDLRTSDEVRRAYERLQTAIARLGAVQSEGVLVQPFVRGGVETIVGLAEQSPFGTLLMLGLGGTLVETLGVVTWRACPIDVTEAETMIDDLSPLARLLAGVRGAPPADRPALAHALALLSTLPAALGDRLESLDVNPLSVRRAGEGVLALDALVVLK